MTGIERLREFAKGCRLTRQKAYSNAIGDIADQIEREQACDGDTAENIRLIVGGVVDEMERHVLGHDGMEDSPVARWARVTVWGGEDYDLCPDCAKRALRAVGIEEASHDR